MRARIEGRFLLPLLVLLPWSYLASCQDPVDPPDPGELTVSVLVEGEGIGGLQIRVTGPVSRAETTNSEGAAVFPELPPGGYTVTITNPPTGVEFSDAAPVVTVPSGGSATASLVGSWKPGSLAGVVRVDGMPMGGEELDLHGPVSRYASTSVSGHFEFPDLPSGEYTLALRTLGDRWEYDFPETSTTVTVTRGETTMVNFFGTAVPPGVIVGRVFLDQDGDHEFDPGETQVVGTHMSVNLDGPGYAAGTSLGDNGEYRASRVRPGGPITIWLSPFSIDNPWGFPQDEYTVDPDYSGNQDIFVERGETVRVDLPVVPGVSREAFTSSGTTITLASGVTLVVPPPAVSEATVVSLIPSSVDVGHETIPTLSLHPDGLTLLEDASLIFSAPLFVPYPAGSTVWYYDEQTEKYEWIPTTLSNGGQEANVSFNQFKVLLAPFFADPVFWPDLGDWFLPPLPAPE